MRAEFICIDWPEEILKFYFNVSKALKHFIDAGQQPIEYKLTDDNKILGKIEESTIQLTPQK